MIRKWKRFDVRDIENLKEDISAVTDKRTGHVLYRILTVIDNDLAEMREMIEDLKNKGKDKK